MKGQSTSGTPQALAANHTLQETDFTSLSKLLAKERGNKAKGDTGTFTFEHARRGRWAFAVRGDGLFVAVRADNSPFAPAPSDITRRLSVKNDVVVTASAGMLRGWSESLRKITVTRECALCDGVGRIDLNELEERARYEVLEDEAKYYGRDDARRKLSNGDLDEDIQAQIAEYTNGKAIEDDGPCPKCEGRMEITRTFSLARIYLCIFKPDRLREALSLPFIDDGDEVTVHVHNARRPSAKDLRKPISLISRNWVISLPTAGYSTKTTDYEDSLPAELSEIPELLDYLRTASVDPEDAPLSTPGTAEERRIREHFKFDDGGAVRPNLMEARRLVDTFCRMKGASSATLRLRLFYVEAGIEFLQRFGEQDMSFYKSLENMFSRVLKEIVESSALAEYDSRCRNILTRSRFFLRTFHEGLCALFADAERAAAPPSSKARTARSSPQRPGASLVLLKPSQVPQTTSAATKQAVRRRQPEQLMLFSDDAGKSPDSAASQPSNALVEENTPAVVRDKINARLAPALKICR